MVRDGWRFHGARFPFILAHRAGVFAWRRWFGAQTFELAGRPHRYVIHPFILDNERAVEIALARDFLQGRSGEILELGNVLSNYFVFPHDIVDKYEQAPGVRNEDIVTFAPGKRYDCIVTLSTLEHVGWDERPQEPDKVARAIARLKALLKDDGELLATMPLGYNPHVDQMVREGRTGFSEVRFLRRVSADNQWREARWEEVATARFGTPYPCANAIVVGYVRRSSA